jgi:hypothetical protein
MRKFDINPRTYGEDREDSSSEAPEFPLRMARSDRASATPAPAHSLSAATALQTSVQASFALAPNVRFTLDGDAITAAALRQAGEPIREAL